MSIQEPLSPPLDLDDILALPAGRRIEPLVAHALELAAAQPRDKAAVESAMLGLIELVRGCAGDSKQRLQMGIALGALGDPRLRVPEDPAYWSLIEGMASPFKVGRFPVTTAEFRAWAISGGYQDDAAWSEAGLAWRNASHHAWMELAEADDVADLVVANQPVVGVNWWEAQAYATAKRARLLTLEERRFVVRGPEKRPYPWGEPFGSGNANTREEVLGRPCAIGLFYSDKTPDGVWDLAGNVAEWCADASEDSRVIHPGSWQQPSMASWAKALEMIAPETRSADLGFRLAKDA
ncbi:MAG: SUMF1/EgtB/PvdO family nonheme iron enzyme [Oligoflexia bacterium]|nr:SUMF1/EgtB/PvdO family nonheme iron enzyme [Oligoflexia bacterium]